MLGLKLNHVSERGPLLLNIFRPRQMAAISHTRFVFKRIFLNENVWISLTILWKFGPKYPINNIPALVQIMAWRRSCDKPFSEPITVRLLTHICGTRPQWVNAQLFSDRVVHCIPANLDIALECRYGIKWHIQQHNQCIWADVHSNNILRTPINHQCWQHTPDVLFQYFTLNLILAKSAKLRPLKCYGD